jgi:hypothetical protein
MHLQQSRLKGFESRIGLIGAEHGCTEKTRLCVLCRKVRGERNVPRTAMRTFSYVRIWNAPWRIWLIESAGNPSSLTRNAKHGFEGTQGNGQTCRPVRRLKFTIGLTPVSFGRSLTKEYPSLRFRKMSWASRCRWSSALRKYKHEVKSLTSSNRSKVPSAKRSNSGRHRAIQSSWRKKSTWWRKAFDSVA